MGKAGNVLSCEQYSFVESIVFSAGTVYDDGKGLYKCTFSLSNCVSQN